jgi:hypothetical protein
VESVPSSEAAGWASQLLGRGGLRAYAVLYLRIKGP